MTNTEVARGLLPGWKRPLAVVAHSDDESFGLGALLSPFAAQKTVRAAARGD